MTSKRLMKNLGEVGVFHIDGTYKLMKNGFPTIVFGITFCYPDVTILMCYFHVMKNMKSYQIHLPPDKRVDMIEHVRIIHKSMDQSEYVSEINKFKIKYEDYKEFYDLASKWFIGRFNQWQVFRTPAGWTNTAGCELFNAVIKREYTLHKKMSVGKLMETFRDITIYYSSNSLKFEYLPKYEYGIKKRALLIDKSKFKKVNSHEVQYDGTSGFSFINLNDRSNSIDNCSCSCYGYLKRAVCVHLVAYSILFDKKWFGDQYNMKDKLVYKTKRGAKKVLIKEEVLHYVLTNDKHLYILILYFYWTFNIIRN